MSVAITTSLTNYIDPRLIVSWVQENSLDIKDIYSKLLLRKFKWSIEMIEEEQGWDWVDSPLIGEEELEPSTGKQNKKPDIIKRKDNKKPFSSKPLPIPQSDPESDLDTPEIELPESDLDTPEIELPESDSDTPEIKSDTPEIELPENKPPIVRVIPRVGPGTISDYKYFLEICEDPQKFRQNFIHISKEAFEWIYHFSKYAISKGTTVKANEYIVQFYEKAYKDKPNPSSYKSKPPPIQKPPVQKPSSYKSKPPPTQKPKSKPPPKPPLKPIHINDKRFEYLNFTLYNNKKHLQEYCDTYNITYNKSKDDKNQLKLLIMEFFADKKKYPNPPTF